MGKIKIGVLFTICFVVMGLLSINAAYAGYGGSQGGSAGGDSTVPTISNINAAVSAEEATITWTTNESSISWVVYGTTTAYGLEVKTTSYITSHSSILPNLTPSTIYHYSVKSKDSAGNIGSYVDQTLTTLAEGEVEIPVFEKPISEMTIPEFQAKIAEISAAVKKLQTQLLAQLKGGIPNIANCTITSFTRNLKQGDIGDDIKCLQIILNSSTDTQVATIGVGSPGRETTYFGLLTKAAVIKFQEKYASEVLASWGLTKGTGLVGSTTRAKLNALLGK